MYKITKSPLGKYLVCKIQKGIALYSLLVVKAFVKEDDAKKYLLELEGEDKNG